MQTLTCINAEVNIEQSLVMPLLQGILRKLMPLPDLLAQSRATHDFTILIFIIISFCSHIYLSQ